jgi:hypothetical protein
VRSPVLFLVFNRPETTRQVFNAIRAARPPKLYVAADGPRQSRHGEAELCSEVRDTVAAVDWPCEVHTLFRTHNLGCREGVSSGIAWFFSHESEGIILEDDVLPIPTFFDFCDEMLERYRNDGRVAMVSGSNLVSGQISVGESYFFTYYCNIWGWATWRRVWEHYDVTMKDWPNWRDNRGLRRVSDGGRLFETYWRRVLDSVHGGTIDTWDYQWTFNCWRLGGLTILPKYNQTRNLGFGSGATHTTTEAPKFLQSLRTQQLRFPLVHPQTVKRTSKADALIGSRVFGIDLIGALKRSVLSIGVFRRAFSSVKTSLRHAIRR